jgi:DNA phosphorothioation-dependent restriction protein DptG
LGESDFIAKSIVYNNISEVYKILGQYDKALRYINKAFNCITDNDLARIFVYFNTYTEIKILMGERESVLDEFLALLVKVEDFHLYKGLIIEGISNMIVIGSEDENILRRLESAIKGLIESNKCSNEEYIKELKICLENIRLCQKELKN